MSKSFYDIITVPAPVLKQQAQAVETLSADIKTQMERMVETMYGANGIGLAANQVGLLNRVLVLDVPEGSWEYNGEEDGILTIGSCYRSGEADEKPEQSPVMMANPEIVWESEQKSVFEEGCLSIPGQHANVVRPAKVRVKYLDQSGKEQEMEAAGLLSHCVQHEIDHLNGVLFVDYLSKLKRDTMIKRVAKMKKNQIL